MTKFLRGVGRLATDMVLLTIVAVVLLALWGLREVDTTEAAAATVRVQAGEAAVLDAAGEVVRSGAGSMTLRPGQSVRTGAGTEAYIFYPDGSTSRLGGGAEVALEESERTIKRPAVLAGVFAQLRSEPPPPPAEARLTLRARAIQGEVVTKAAVRPAGSSFEMWGPGVVVYARDASYALTVPESGDVALEVGKGPISAAFLSPQGEHLVPIVVPALDSRTGIAIPNLDAGQAAKAKSEGSLEKLAVAVPDVLVTSRTDVASRGVTYRRVGDGRIPHFVGDTAGGARASDAASSAMQASAAAKQAELKAELKTDPPGVRAAQVTEEDIVRALRGVLPGSASARILPGGVVQVAYEGTTFTASVGVEDGRVALRGLPLAFSPEQLTAGVQQATGAPVPPLLLAISSQDGSATVLYETEPVVAAVEPRAPAELPASLPHTAEYFKNIPTPREISTDWKVVGSNVLLATGITLLIKVFVGFASAFAQARDTQIARLYAPLIQAGKRTARPLGGALRPFRWLAPGPLASFVLMMFLFGAIYSFLSQGSGLLAPEGMVVFLTFSFTSGFMALYDTRVRAHFAKKMKMAAQEGVYMGQLGVAMLSVGISRIAAITPGLMVGVFSGLKLPSQATVQQKFLLGMVSVAALLALAAAAWGGVFLLTVASVQPWAEGLFRTVPGVTSGFQDWGLAVFAMAVQRALFPLLPLPGSAGKELMKRRWWLWAGMFVVVLFVFLHTQVNQERTVTGFSSEMYISLAIAVALGGLAQVYTLVSNLRKRKEGGAKATAASLGGVQGVAISTGDGADGGGTAAEMHGDDAMPGGDVSDGHSGR